MTRVWVQHPFSIHLSSLLKPLTYEFGFQATPVKPMMEDRRAWNFDMHRDTPHQNARNWFTQHAQLVGTWKVANRLPEEADVVVEIDREGMGLAGKTLRSVNARTGKAVVLAGNRFTVHIPQRNYTFVRITAD